MPNNPQDEAEILALIHANRIAHWTANFEAWDNCFVHAPYTMRWGWWQSGGTFVRQGWEEIRARGRINHPGPRDDFAYETKVLNLSLQIGTDMAWASFDQLYPGNVPGRIGPGIVHEVRVFERHDGKWRIAFLGFLDGNAGRAGDQVLGLDRDRRVLWSSPAAVAKLEESDDLVIRNGHLSFRDRAVDRKLDAALRWAASFDSGLNSRHGAVPIAVEAGDRLASHIYWVMSDGGRILFSFADNRVGDERLAAATVIFGLSLAQSRVAKLVAEGRTLNEIAAEMGITPNTARTHLQRVFEKTGVRNQTALVRVLLSAVAPI